MILNNSLIIATHNNGKLNEFTDLFAFFGIKVLGAGAFGLAEPDETGATFAENARIKALACAQATGKQALADDSGLCVDGLDGAPGIFSARWAVDGDFGVAMERVHDELLKRQIPHEHWLAHFVCVLSLAQPDGSTREFSGRIDGMLIWPPRGDEGFGYDPMFLPDGYSTTFGEMSADQKHGWKPGSPALSHRARAFANFAHHSLAPAKDR